MTQQLPADTRMSQVALDVADLDLMTRFYTDVLLLEQVGLLTLFNLVRYALLVGFPVVVYLSMRRMRFSTLASAVAAAAASLFSTDGRFGFEYGSYLWHGSGMYTQLWAMVLSFVTLACVDRLVSKGKGHVAAVVTLTLLVLCHLLYVYMMAISAALLLLVGLRRDNAGPRIVRLAVVGGLVALITSYMFVPFFLGRAYLNASPYLQSWKYDSYGAENILKALVSGDLLDFGRLPVLTALLALGLAAAVLTRTRPARIALVLFVVWLLLYFGRPTWGRLIDILPLHEGLLLHRFSGGVHLAAILLIGLGADWLWRQVVLLPRRWRAAAVGVLVLVLLVPALQERHRYYATNTNLMERSRRAVESDADARAVLAKLRDLPPGRTHAGIRGRGVGLRFGELHFYDLLTFHRIVAASAPYSGVSLNAEFMWHFDDHNAAHYDLFDVKYLVAPRGWSPPDFLRPLEQTGRYVLYEAPTRGYAEFAVIAERASPASQLALFFQNRSWFLGTDPAAGKFVRYDFPPGRSADSAGAPEGGPLAGERSGCFGGKTGDERISPGRVDLRVECPTPSTLVLKMTYHPNWRVAVDDQEARTFMVSPSFIGVELPPGAHSVRAEYRSGLLKTSLLILGGVTLVGVIGFRRRFEQLERHWLARG